MFSTLINSIKLWKKHYCEYRHIRKDVFVCANCYNVVKKPLTLTHCPTCDVTYKLGDEDFFASTKVFYYERWFFFFWRELDLE